MRVQNLVLRHLPLRSRGKLAFGLQLRRRSETEAAADKTRQLAAACERSKVRVRSSLPSRPSLEKTTKSSRSKIAELRLRVALRVVCLLGCKIRNQKKEKTRIKKKKIKKKPPQKKNAGKKGKKMERRKEKGKRKKEKGKKKKEKRKGKREKGKGKKKREKKRKEKEKREKEKKEEKRKSSIHEDV